MSGRTEIPMHLHIGKTVVPCSVRFCVDKNRCREAVGGRDGTGRFKTLPRSARCLILSWRTLLCLRSSYCQPTSSLIPLIRSSLHVDGAPHARYAHRAPIYTFTSIHYLGSHVLHPYIACAYLPPSLFLFRHLTMFYQRYMHLTLACTHITRL